MKKFKIIKFFKYIITFIGLIIIFNLLLFLGSLFPSNLLEKNVKESAKTLLTEGNRYQIIKTLDVYNDNYTDSIMINTAYSIDNTNPIYSYMSGRKNFNSQITKNSLEDASGELISINTLNEKSLKNNSIIVSEEYEPVIELNEFINGKIHTSINYARYWHGYLPFLRILLLVFNISQIRIFLLILFIIILFYLIYLINKKLGNIIAFLFGFSLIVYDYFLVSYSLQNAPIFLVMLISCIILLKNLDRIKNFSLFTFIIGCIANFVDFLTVPIITLGFPLLLYICYKQQNNYKNRDLIKIILKSTLTWFIGFGLTWISKWILFDFIYNSNLLELALNQIIYRSTGNLNFSTSNLSRLTESKAIVELPLILAELLSKGLIYASIVFVIISIPLAIYIKKSCIKLTVLKFKVWIQQCFPLIIISLLPLFWYILLSSHTTKHLFFTYRNMSIFLFAVSICLSKLLSLQKKQ